GPGQLRKVACDTTLIPYVLGSAGEIIDQGVAVRLYTRAQRRRLWMRDGGCTYPGCTAPGTWCRAHHVQHWADSGPTDLHNAALLCERHHTIVHTRRLWAEVRERPDQHGRYVTWDPHNGSYDRALAGIRERETEERIHERRRAAALEQVVRLAEVQHARWQADDEVARSVDPDPWDPVWDQFAAAQDRWATALLATG
ncbi:MAG: HNH endonuclease signature motif containing protein, partial [Phycicoccus sp.]